MQNEVIMSDLEIEITDGVMTATFNRPEKLNALNNNIRIGLRNALAEASQNDEVKVLVLTGTGRAFCAGAEVTREKSPAHNGSTTGELSSRYDRMNIQAGSSETVQAFAKCDVPIIGAINGVTAGAGFGIALCCDIRFFSEQTRIGSIFSKRGLASDYGAAYWLPRLVGQAKAFEMLYSGDLISAEEALQIGLTNKIFPSESLLSETLSFAKNLAAGAPMALTAIRRLVLESTDTIERNLFLDREWSIQAQLLKSNDSKEGFQSFLDNRPPEFTGT